MSEPVFVEKSWVDKVDAAIENDAPPQPVAPPPSSRFYDVRPIDIRSGWSQNNAGVWSANAAFIVNDSIDTSFIFPVYAPLSLGERPGTFASTKMFAIWRGRWEILPQKNPTLDVTTEQVVKSIPEFGSNRFLLAGSITQNIISVTLTSYDNRNDVPDDGTAPITYVSGMQQIGTAWQPVIKYLHLKVQTQPVTATSALTGLSGTIDYTNVVQTVAIR